MPLRPHGLVVRHGPLLLDQRQRQRHLLARRERDRGAGDELPRSRRQPRDSDGASEGFRAEQERAHGERVERELVRLGGPDDVLEGQRGEEERGLGLGLAVCLAPVAAAFGATVAAATFAAARRRLLLPPPLPPAPLRRPLGDGDRGLLRDKVQERGLVARDGGGQQGGDGFAGGLVWRGGGPDEGPRRSGRLREETPTQRRLWRRCSR